jgi:hypothetical protein
VALYFPKDRSLFPLGHGTLEAATNLLGARRFAWFWYFVHILVFYSFLPLVTGLLMFYCSLRVFSAKQAANTVTGFSPAPHQMNVAAYVAGALPRSPRF